MQKPIVNTIRGRHSTIIGTLFKYIANLILLIMLSCLFLTLWFFFESLQFDNCIIQQRIHSILNSCLKNINNKYEIISILFALIQNLKNNLIIILSYLVNSELNSKIVEILIGSIAIIIIRTLFFIVFVPFILLIYFLFIVDGLVQRDIRKFQGARESTFFFHRIKALPGFCFYILFFIYLILPWPISPELLLVLMTLSSGYFIQLSIKNYKKYL